MIQHVFPPTLELLAQNQVSALIRNRADFLYAASLGTATGFHAHTARRLRTEDGATVGLLIFGSESNADKVANHFADIRHGDRR